MLLLVAGVFGAGCAASIPINASTVMLFLKNDQPLPKPINPDNLGVPTTPATAPTLSGNVDKPVLAS